MERANVCHLRFVGVFGARRRQQMRHLVRSLSHSMLSGPARISSESAADTLGIPEAILAALARDGIIVPLGVPAANAPKRFYAPYIAHLHQHVGFIDQVERYRHRYWARRSSRSPNCSNDPVPNGPLWTAFPLKIGASTISDEVIRSASAIDPVVGIGVVQELLGFLPHELRILVRSKSIPVGGGCEQAWRHKRFYFRSLLELYHDPKAMDRAERVITAHWKAKNAPKAEAPS